MNKEGEKNLEMVMDGLKEKELSTISDVISRIMDVIKDPKSNTIDLARVLQTDQVLSSRLLKLANSVIYNPSGKKIDDLRTAIIRVGYNEAQEIATSAVICDMFQSKEQIADYSRIDLWKHSVAVATSNKLIYTGEFRSGEGYPYLAGLLHDIGIVMEDQFLHYSGFIEAVSNRYANKTNLIQEEMEYLGITHEEIGKAVAKQLWNFPDNLITSIGCHHNIDSVSDEQQKKLIYTTKLSEFICNQPEYGYTDFSQPNTQEMYHIQRKLKINDASVSSLKTQLNKEFDKLKKSGWFVENA